MLDLLLVSSLLALYLLGMACMLLAQDKHWRTLGLLGHRQPWVLLLGCCCSSFSLLLAWAYQGPVFGSLIWLLLLSPSGFALAFTLAWRPQWFRPLAMLLVRQGE